MGSGGGALEEADEPHEGGYSSRHRRSANPPSPAWPGSERSVHRASASAFAFSSLLSRRSYSLFIVPWSHSVASSGVVGSRSEVGGGVSLRGPRGQRDVRLLQSRDCPSIKAKSKAMTRKPTRRQAAEKADKEGS